MANKKTASPYKNLLILNVAGLLLLPILLLKLSVIPERYELLVYWASLAGLALAGYFGWRAAGDRSDRYENLGGVFFVAGTLFITADMELLGERGLTVILALILLGLGGYFSWRAGMQPSEG